MWIWFVFPIEVIIVLVDVSFLTYIKKQESNAASNISTIPSNDWQVKHKQTNLYRFLTYDDRLYFFESIKSAQLLWHSKLISTFLLKRRIENEKKNLSIFFFFLLFALLVIWLPEPFGFHWRSRRSRKKTEKMRSTLFTWIVVQEDIVSIFSLPHLRVFLFLSHAIRQ